VNSDADNQYLSGDIPKLTGPIVRGVADMVVGDRPISEIKEFSSVKKVLQRVGSWVVRMFSGTKVRDAASGFRAVNRGAAMRLRVFGRYTYTMETLVQAGWEGLRVASVPIGVNPKTRDSRLVRSIPRYVFRSATTIVRSFALYKPFRFFAFLGTPFVVIGFALIVRWLIFYLVSASYSSRLPGLFIGVGFLLVGFQLWAVAFVADLLAANRRILSELTLRLRSEELVDRP
jgi:hypothetical protein